MKILVFDQHKKGGQGLIITGVNGIYGRPIIYVFYYNVSSYFAV